MARARAFTYKPPGTAPPKLTVLTDGARARATRSGSGWPAEGPALTRPAARPDQSLFADVWGAAGPRGLWKKIAGVWGAAPPRGPAQRAVAQ